MSNPAWQVRDMEIDEAVRRAVENTCQSLSDIAEGSFTTAVNVQFGLLHVMINFLRPDEYPAENLIESRPGEPSALAVFYNSVLAPIEMISRSRAEKMSMVIAAFQKLFDDAVGDWARILTSERIQNPQEMYAAPTATTEVEYYDPADEELGGGESNG